MKKTSPHLIAVFIVSICVHSLLLSEHNTAVAKRHIITNAPYIKQLQKAKQDSSFTFAIFGDRTGGNNAGLDILRHAVADVNVLGPDLVMTVGDLIQGYNQTPDWIAQANEYNTIMKQLKMPWYPVAGNHDIYWRGENQPPHQHEKNYTRHFGPLWYAFEHKSCWFIILFSDELNEQSGDRNFKNPDNHRMSNKQKQWLIDTLIQAKQAKHVFIFIHHPRWDYAEANKHWVPIHNILKAAGNVSAVFAGHTHTMKYGGKKDGIEYFTLAVTGGATGKDGPQYGHLQHYDLVTVRDKKIHVAAVPVEAVIDPRLPRIKTIDLFQHSFHINKNDQRTLSYPITIPPFKCKKALLKIIITGSRDDSGDKGMYFQVLDAKNKVVRDGFSTSNSAKITKFYVKANQTYTLLLIDKDTSIHDGQYSGNGGEVKAKLICHLNKYITIKQDEFNAPAPNKND